MPADNPLGDYLRDRRARLDPVAFGLPAERRRTPGLRREEVAQRANISAAWYTWLEQGRGGGPSADVLDRIARAMLLTDAEREHMFLLALGRPPEAHYRKAEGVSPRLQRVLDAFGAVPAFIRTPIFDVVAWNRAATMVFVDYGALPPGRRNVLRSLFLDPGARRAHDTWESVARFVVGAFRAETARAGAMNAAEPLIDELRGVSPEFDTIWRDNDLGGFHADDVKHMHHPTLGNLAFHASQFYVDGRTDLTLVVYNPATPQDAGKITRLLDEAAYAPV